MADHEGGQPAEPNSERGDPARSRLGAALLWCAALLGVLILAAARTRGGPIETRPDVALAMFFALRQDIPVATLGLVLLVGWRMALGRPQVAGAGIGPRLPGGWNPGGGTVLAGFVVLAAAIALLRLYVLGDHDLSRDEQMVTFDAAIYATGHLFAPIPPFWRPYYEALNVTFLLPIGDREAWVSGYLPGNAALRALLGMALPPAAIGGLFVAIAGLALWRIAVRLFPDSPSTRLVMLVLFASSSQVVLTATTTYAMSAHMTANLVWLWLFLQRRPLAHGAAIALGFVATGLHQPVFHPLFVAPFLLLLARERAWKELAAYVLGYGAIGLFWLGWQPWLSAQGLHPVPVTHGTDGASFLERLQATMPPFGAFSFWVMAANLLRFATWQNLALFPLAAIPLLSARRRDPLVMALWLGPLMLVVLLIAILPGQLNGWGYRYLAGFIGNGVLLAGLGWRWLEARGAAPARAFALATAVAVLVILPVHVAMAGSQIRAYAAAARAVRAINADVVIVDEGIPFAADLVLNRPDLSNRPILLAHSRLASADLAALCAGRTLGFADAPLFAPVSRFFGLPPATRATPGQERVKQAARDLGCTVRSSASDAPANRTSANGLPQMRSAHDSRTARP